MPGNPRTVCLIVAAGTGSRAGNGPPKQYRSLGGEPLLRHAARRLAAQPAIDEVRIVIDPEHRELYEDAIAGLDLGPPVFGGATRQQSVLNGLEALSDVDHVLIHDAARPFVPPALVPALIAALVEHDGAVPALRVVDSLRRGRKIVEAEIAREDIHRVQTPQAFRFALLLAAHRKAPPGATDDAAIAAAAGLSVALVPGDEDLFKLTYRSDFARAERLIDARASRIGIGFDVHRFESGDRVMLCGIEIPHSAALAGHSDADVGLHSLTDAILGALAAGDIGDHFPPGDPEWRGAGSERFLSYARDLVAAAGGGIEHVDITLICEEPKIGPHRPAMRQRVADILQLPLARISVKATTTEKLGFTGRGEGIAAQAAATIRI